MHKLLLLSDLKSLAPILALAILYGVLVGSASPEGTDLAIVVNKSTTLDTVSLADLRSMLLGEKTKWPDGKKVTPVETSPQSPERALLLKAVLKMSDAVLKRYYMQAAFTGKDVLPPPELPSGQIIERVHLMGSSGDQTEARRLQPGGQCFRVFYPEFDLNFTVCRHSRQYRRWIKD